MSPTLTPVQMDVLHRVGDQPLTSQLYERSGGDREDIPQTQMSGLDSLTPQEVIGALNYLRAQGLLSSQENVMPNDPSGYDVQWHQGLGLIVLHNLLHRGGQQPLTSQLYERSGGDREDIHPTQMSGLDQLTSQEVMGALNNLQTQGLLSSSMVVMPYDTSGYNVQWRPTEPGKSFLQ